MFAPLKTWRRWHRKVNIKQKRHAVAAALAASAVTPLVLARGHRISNIPNLPLVVEDKIETIEKTREVIALLKRLGAHEDVERVANSKTIRPGKAKLRNKRYRLRRGPLFVYNNENVNLVRAARNVPGVETCNVHRLNLKQLAPGGHLGRFIIWTESAFRALDKIFGSYRSGAQEKNGYHLHRTSLTNPDIAKIINSDAVQTAIRARKQNKAIHSKQKKNPLVNAVAMERLNPHHAVLARMDRQANENNRNRRNLALKAKRGFSASKSAEEKKDFKSRKQASRAFITGVHKNLLDAYEKKDEQ